MNSETQWRYKETDADLALMAEVLGISEVTANVLANRGLRTKKTAQAFLRPLAAPLHDTMLMKGAAESLTRIISALKKGEKIVVYGDYDVDGVTSTVIVYRVLKRLGGWVDYYIPHRVEEGYGLNHNAVKSLAEGGTELLITVDNGISAVEEIGAAAALGMDTVVIDHHEAGESLPPAVAIVDPKQPGCAYPFKELCAGGVAFKLMGALCERLNTPYLEEGEMSVFAAMACICDIVALQDENRTLVHRGLTALNQHKHLNPGLGALITQRGYLDKPIDTYCIGFIIGPCLNATGRLNSAALAVELLLTDEIDRRLTLAQELAALNNERKELTADCVERALAVLEKETALPKVIVLTDPEAHESVAGIVAGRVRDHTGHPTILLTKGDGGIKGSGRSIAAYNLFEALYKHKHLFQRFGGHAMAAGLSMVEENIPALTAALNKDCTLTPGDFQPIFDIDCFLQPGDISLELSRELEALAPFGKGNAAPLFATLDLQVTAVRNIEAKNTLIFTFKNPAGYPLKGIAFGQNKKYAEWVEQAGVSPTGGYSMDVAYRIETNVYNGSVSVQLGIRDMKIAP